MASATRRHVPTCAAIYSTSGAGSWTTGGNSARRSWPRVASFLFAEPPRSGKIRRAVRCASGGAVPYVKAGRTPGSRENPTIQLLPCPDGSYRPLGGGDTTADDLLDKRRYAR